MEIELQRVIEDLLEQNKQLALQLAVARATVAQLRIEQSSTEKHSH